jgi:hypothetical protein
MTYWPDIHPDWVNNIRKYGRDVVDIVTIRNGYNDQLWYNMPLSESRFYFLVSVLATGWFSGLEMRNAYFHWRTGWHYQVPQWTWGIPASNGHGTQYLDVDAPYTGWVAVDTGGGDTKPNMRPGFSLPANTLTKRTLCTNYKIVSYLLPTYVPPIIPMMSAIASRATVSGTLTVHHIHMFFEHMDMILMPTPWVQWDQSYELDAVIQMIIEKLHTQSMILMMVREANQYMTTVLQKDFMLPQYMSLQLRETREKSMSMSVHTLKNVELHQDMTMKIVLWSGPEDEHTMDMVILKHVEYPQHMYLNLKQEGEEFQQTMDMRLVHVPHRDWILPQHWDLQTVQELDSNSTRGVFDSRNEADRQAAGGV